MKHFLCMENMCTGCVKHLHTWSVIIYNIIIGCGNSDMKVCLDLCDHNVTISLVVRDRVHVLSRDILGKSTFGLSMWLLKWLPIRLSALALGVMANSR